MKIVFLSHLLTIANSFISSYWIKTRVLLLPPGTDDGKWPWVVRGENLNLPTNRRMVQATERPEQKECFDRKKSPTLIRVSIKLSAILFTDFDQFESLKGQGKKTEFVNSIMNFSNGRLSVRRRCCLTKGLAVLKRKSTKRHRPSEKPSEIFWRMRSRSV